jgi:hypothetical protein
LQHIANVLKVPIDFFFDLAPTASTPSYVSDFLATTDGAALAKAFVRLRSSGLRRSIVRLVQQIASEENK